MIEPLLVARDITLRYGGVVALDRVSLEVRPGETVGLIGPNGAGKTTLFECIAGFNDAADGRVSFGGVELTDASPEARAARGLIRSFQDARLFESLTVHQVVLAAHEKVTRSSVLANLAGLPVTRRAEREKAEAADRLIETMGLVAYRDKLVSEISTGTRRITELACVLALEPKLLLLDEPSSGIAQREVEALGDLLRGVKASTGCTLLMIEHDMPLIMGLADRIVALESGRVLSEGTPAEIADDPRVVESYLGTNADAINRSGIAPAAANGGPRRDPPRPARARRTRPLVAATRTRATTPQETP